MNIAIASQHDLRMIKPVQITSFGKLSLEIDGQCIDIQKWKSPKVYQLLLYLVSAGGKNIPSHEICDAMWPNQDANNALQNLEFILRRLRQALQKHLPQDLQAKKVLPLHHGKISFNPDYCDMDCWRLDKMIKQTKSLHQQGLCKQAHTVESQIIQDIQGSFMTGETELNYHHRQAWHTRLCNWIHASILHWKKKQYQYYTHIISLLDLGTRIDPYSECLLCQRIEILHIAGYSSDAIRHYQDWSSSLLQSFGLHPSKATLQTYQTITSLYR